MFSSSNSPPFEWISQVDFTSSGIILREGEIYQRKTGSNPNKEIFLFVLDIP